MVASNNTMADNEDAPLDEKVIKRTQDTLGKLIKAPPLTEKLLSRPPFRFLHDVITAVIKGTGFMKGLHADSDLKSDNVKEKEQKVAFLQKTLDYVVFVLGHSISTNPVKVVAGKDADKTNEFLQAIAEAATKKVDNDVMVKRFLGGERFDPSNPSKPSSQKPAVPAAKPPAAQPEAKQEKPHAKEKTEKERTKEKQPVNGEKPSSKPGGHSRGANEDASHKRREESPERPADTTNLKNRPREAGRERGNTRKGESGDDEGEPQPPEQNSADQQSSVRGRLNRPPSARGRQPSGVGARGSRAAEDNASSDQVGGSSTAAKPSKLATPSASDVKTKVIIQKAAKGGDSDEEDEFVVREAGPGAVPLGAPDGTAATLLGANEDQHGALVQKIIDTTKALDAKTGVKAVKMSPAEEAALRRQRETVTREMERLCVAVQASARLAAPLARLSELVQEDLDAMNAELNTWRAEHRKAVAQLAQAANPAQSGAAASHKAGRGAASSTVTATNVSATNEALRGQLRELDSQLAEMADSVAAVRGNCMRNEQRIAHILSGSSGGGTSSSSVSHSMDRR